MAGMRVGDKTPSKIYYGRASVRQVYYGAQKIWPEHPAWEGGKYYNPGDVVEYYGGIYRCTQIHKSNAEYTPYTPGFWLPI